MHLHYTSQSKEISSLMQRFRTEPSLTIKDAGLSFGLRSLLNVTGLESRGFNITEIQQLEKQQVYHMAYGKNYKAI